MTEARHLPQLPCLPPPHPLSAASLEGPDGCRASVCLHFPLEWTFAGTLLHVPKCPNAVITFAWAPACERPRRERGGRAAMEVAFWVFSSAHLGTGGLLALAVPCHGRPFPRASHAAPAFVPA